MSDIGDAAETAEEHIAAAAVVTRPSRPSALAPDTPEGVCTNCGTRLQGPVCHRCGQTGDTYHRPVWSLLAEIADGLFSLDGRLARTLPDLMARPGRVTRRYLQGARARFVQPFKLYILASLLFFVLTPVANGPIFDAGAGADPALSGGAAAEQAEAEAAELEALAEERPELAPILDGAARTRRDAAPPEADPAEAEEETGEAAGEDEPLVRFSGPDGASLQTREQVYRYLLPEDYGGADETGTPTWFRAWLAARVVRAMENPEAMLEEAAAWTPRIMFVMVPVFAGLLALVYAWRRRFFYFDHLITALHFHAAMFIGMTAAALLAGPTGGFSVIAMLIYANIYLYRLQRVVYARGRFATIMRTLTLDALYGVALLIGLIAAIFAGFATV